MKSILGYLIGMNGVRKQQKRIINGKQRQKSEGRFCYQWELRGVFEKKHKKKHENVTCRGVFEKQK